jgi:hypothetical protein
MIAFILRVMIAAEVLRSLQIAPHATVAAIRF